MSLFNFVDFVGPTVPASYLNSLDQIRNALNASLGGAVTLAPIGATGVPGATALSVAQNGAITLANGVTVTTGGLIVSAGGITTSGGGTLNGEIAVGGSATNDNAAAGFYGEYQANSGSAQALTTSSALSLTSVSLTAGDWDVSAIVIFVPQATTSITVIATGVSSTTNNLGATGNYNILAQPAEVPGNNQIAMIAPIVRFSLASTTTIYCVGQMNFTVSTATGQGFIRARRVR